MSESVVALPEGNVGILSPVCDPKIKIVEDIVLASIMYWIAEVEPSANVYLCS